MGPENLTSLVIDAMSDESTGHDGRTRDEPYRLTFGKHRGSTIEEIGPGYRQYLIQKEVYKNHPGFKAALVAGGYLQPVQGADSEPVSPTRKRKALDQTVPSSFQTSKRPALSAGQGKEDATEHTWNSQVADLYFLDFGMHAGKRLHDVPSSYIDWLINKEVYTSRPALATALKALGKLDTPEPAIQDSR